MLLAGEQNLREVALFPMNQRAEDLLIGPVPFPSDAEAAAGVAYKVEFAGEVAAWQSPRHVVPAKAGIRREGARTGGVSRENSKTGERAKAR